MSDMILITLALAIGLVCLLVGQPFGGDLTLTGLGLKRPHWLTSLSRGGLLVSFAAVISMGAVHADAQEGYQTSLSEPEVIVSALINAMQNGDAERIRSLFAAAASQAYGDEAAKSGRRFLSGSRATLSSARGVSRTHNLLLMATKWL